MIRYAHLADLHLGSWRDASMRALSTQIFLDAINTCIQKKVDFILFAGDLFNTSLPSIDTLNIVTHKLRELKEQGIPLYVIAGSHDFSPSGRSMIDVLENAGLLYNVCKGHINETNNKLCLQFTKDPKTNAKITGIIGRRGMLDRRYYEQLDRESLEQETGYKIFMFHTTITELKPKHLEILESAPVSFLPQHCNYYAGGHIHHKTELSLPGYPCITYTGALFPNNFAEMEKYSFGGFFIIEATPVGEQEFNQKLEWIGLEKKSHYKIIINCNEKTVDQIMQELEKQSKNPAVTNSIVTIRLFGRLQFGKISDINFDAIDQLFLDNNAYCVLRNSSKLEQREFSHTITQSSILNKEELEATLISEHLGQSQLLEKGQEKILATQLLTTLDKVKKEGQKVADYEEQVLKEIQDMLINTL